MRDQTWKTLNYSILTFLGVVGLDVSGKISFAAVVISYLTVSVVSLLGFFTGKHHRLRQKQKFDIITLYEKNLGLYNLKKDIFLEKKKFLFTAAFIEGTHLTMIVLQLTIITFKILYD